ncbi:hypothetical protein CJ030_MR0G003213 [Morella rubra]|uniref:F-box domain-containing protein n=1 Tax=Morella rubra TaxID=262757 RepID=A0A6A1UMU7_9ROSI|nr:hypothetical protein CJ030_MR0G003213 [Morella rubra]
MLGQERLKKGTWMNNLPEDIIVEILLQLPVKPLLRFRCVSKRWFSLISDPHFAKSHFKRASERTQRLLLSTSLRLGSLEVDKPFGNGSAVKKLNFPFKQRGRRVKILGSCNGLVCVSLYGHKDFYIWNPSTGDCRKLPDPAIAVHRKNIYIHGFGYDSSTDDYKLLVGSYPLPRPSREAEGKLFSLKSNSWKTVANLFNPEEYCESAGIFSNGALHWQAELIDPRIIAFDLAEEKFREVPMPDEYDDELNEELYFHTLKNLGGRLCFTCYRRTRVELLAMMEYGVLESWAIQFRVVRFDSGYDLTPLCFSKNNELLAMNSCGRELIRSTPQGEMGERFVVCSEPNGCHAAVYVESLLSPNRYHGDEGQHHHSFER